MTVKHASANPAVTRYFTRNFPVALLERARAWAAVHGLTLEDAINRLVKAGLDTMIDGTVDGKSRHK